MFCFSLRIQSLLCLKLFNLKRGEAVKFKKIIDHDHNKVCNKEGMKEIFYLMIHSTHLIFGLYSICHRVNDYLPMWDRSNDLPQHE